MGYLFFQTWLWILFAGLLGLLVGWWIWGRRTEVGDDDSASLRRQLEQCRARYAELEAQIDSASAGDDSAQILSAGTGSNADSGAGGAGSDSGAAISGVQDDWRPAGLSGPEGDADDLKRIRGVGPVIEKTLNGLGIYHFRQVGGFTADNIKWVDNYISFPGRIVREEWVSQAKLLAEGGDTTFSNRYDQGKTKR